jgi:hypothetical protein
VVTGAQTLSVVTDRFTDDRIKAILGMIVEPWLAAAAPPKKKPARQPRTAALR